MELDVKATVPDRYERAIARGLEEIRTAAAEDPDGLQLFAEVRAYPTHEAVEDEDDDGAGAAFELSQIVLTVGVGVLTALAKDAILEAVKQTVKKIASIIGGDERLVVSLRMPTGEYTITRRKDRLALKAQLEADVSATEQAKIEEHLREIEELFSERYQK